MNKTLQLALLVIVLSASMCNVEKKAHQNIESILMDRGYLENVKMSIEKGESQYKPAFDQLLKEANIALEEGPFSVTNKEKLPPSGDNHDYVSYSRYWWPDPSRPDGMPFVRRDGETNPSSQSLKTSDRPRIGKLGNNTETLGLAYYLTEDEKYAVKAAELLRVWFLDKETRMNPNVNHAQCRPGHNNGSKSGILDGRLLIQALEGSILIGKSSALTDQEQKDLILWTKEYFNWLTSNEMALQEAASKNNHGSFYDLQAIYFALFSQNYEAATKVAENFYQNRILSQIKEDGSMPEEMARTRPLFYSIYNLHAMFVVANLAEKVGVDIWKTEYKDSRLKAALDYLVPYTDENVKWPHPTLKETDRMELLAILQMANESYPDGNYLEKVESLPIEKRQLQRSNLVIPVMR